MAEKTIQIADKPTLDEIREALLTGDNALKYLMMYEQENNQLLKNASYGLPTLKDLLTNSTYGLSALKTLISASGGGTSYPNISTDTLGSGSVTVSGKGKLLMYGVTNAIVVCSFSVDGSETLGVNLGHGDGTSNNNTVPFVQVTFEKSIKISITSGMLRYFIQLA